MLCARSITARVPDPIAETSVAGSPHAAVAGAVPAAGAPAGAGVAARASCEEASAMPTADCSSRRRSESNSCFLLVIARPPMLMDGSESVVPGEMPSEYQCMHVFRAFIRIHGFQVLRVPHHRVLRGNAIAT